MFGKILTSALFAGFVAGLIAALLQLVFVQPVLLHAELYEGGDLVHFGDPTGATAEELLTGGIDLARDGLSMLFSALIYVGYGLLLVAAMSIASEQGADIDWRCGAVWGIAGFVAVQMAPAFGLPPELPGNAAAELGVRQVWWFATIGCTAVALWLFAFGRSWVTLVPAVALILAPHIVGAPHTDAFYGPVPPELAGEFAARALGVGLAAWAVLGALAGYFWQRESAA